MNYQQYLLPALLLPIACFLLLGLFGKKYIKNVSGIICTVSMIAVTVLALSAAGRYFFTDGNVNGVYVNLIAYKYNWLAFTPTMSIDIGAIVDPISMMMIVIVSFISLMVHIFSLAYMKGEDRFPAYYAYLSLFTFSMLGLVLSSNIFQMYIFWELVGISSFLLIGFYYNKPSAVVASQKAFIVTRFADFGFLIGILILSFYGDTLDFNTLIQRLTTPQSGEYMKITGASFLGISMLTWGLSLVFVGGAGKSAMFPLHIWLPDAMEGPTPVSALIHAATMVVAGVYLIARLFPVFSIDVSALQIVSWVGALSALIAAIIACTQTDIKRVLAYSTMSQIGYMMFALGVARYGGENGLGYMASLFHLFTHAFFKSLLFLCAAVIIHFIHSNDLKDMGGLRKLMPVTHITFLIACLAIAGVPPFAGFFSKEEILTAAFRSNKIIYGIALFTAMLTAFYMFRLYFSIFWRKEIHTHDAHHADGTTVMKIPLIILTVCSVAAGFVPFAKLVTSDGLPLETHQDISFSLAPVTFVLLAIFIAARLYKKENAAVNRLAASFGSLYKAAKDKFYVDELYLFITRKVIFNLIGRPAAWIDRHIIDAFVNEVAATTARISSSIKNLQSGKVQVYALYFFSGIAGLAVLFIYFRK